MSQKKLLILNGPGLADPGTGDGNTSGNLSLQGIQDECAALCEKSGIELDFRQTDDEDEMFRWIAKDSADHDALIINPADSQADSSLSRDYSEAVSGLGKPVIEVHMTNIFRDEPQTTAPLQVPESGIGFVCGLGVHGYLLAIKSLERRLNDS